jgi:hypothetical protein
MDQNTSVQNAKEQHERGLSTCSRTTPATKQHVARRTRKQQDGRDGPPCTTSGMGSLLECRRLGDDAPCQIRVTEPVWWSFKDRPLLASREESAPRTERRFMDPSPARPPARAGAVASVVGDGECSAA